MTSDRRMSITATIHQDDGSGHCAACGTVWPTECAAERHAVWVARAKEMGPPADTHDPSGMDEYHPDSSWNPGGDP